MKANLYISNSNSRIKLLVKLILFSLLILVIDQVIGFSTNYLLWNKNNNNLVPAEIIKRAINYKPEIVILGSSRAMHHYNPEIIETVLGIKTFNLGIGGTNSYDHLNILQLLSTSAKPKCVIYDIYYPLSINTDFDIDKTISYIYPLIKDTHEIFEIEKISFIEPLLLKLNFYKYNSAVYSIYKSVLIPKKDNTKNGFFPLKNINGNKNFRELNYPLNLKFEYYNLSKYIQEMMSYCKENDINLIFVVSPMHTLQNEQVPFIFKEYFSQNNIPLLIFNDLEFNTNPKWFKDAAHLNNEGANEFSAIFSKELIMLMNQ